MNGLVQATALVAEATAEAVAGIAHGQAPLITILTRLSEVLHADAASYGWINTITGDCYLQTWPDNIDVALMMQTTERSPRSHPVLDFWLEGNTSSAVVSSLITDRRAWRNSEAFALLKQALGCTETGGIRLDAGTRTVRSIGFARKRDFTSEEVELLEIMRLPTIAITTHAEWLSRVTGTRSGVDSAFERSSRVGLTSREFEVLQLLATGCLASTIGAHMSISTRTVHRHLSHIYGKLGTHDRLTTVIRAGSDGLLLEAGHNHARAWP